MEKLPLGIVSDEISQDFSEALEYGISWGIETYEIRLLTTGRIPQVDDAEVERVAGLIREKGVHISAVSPGIFKHPVTRKDDLEHELTAVLPKTFEFAERVGSERVIVFGFQLDQNSGREDQEPHAIELMQRAASIAEDAGHSIAVENEPGFIFDTGSNSARLTREIGKSNFGVNWDPCNSYGMDERPYPEGYEAVKPHIVNVHAKDTETSAHVKCIPLGEGNVDWKGQVRSLMQDRIVPHLTIETHCEPLIENSRKNVEYLHRLMEEILAEEQG